MISKIKKRPLSEEVYEQIKNNLFSGEFKEGSLIPSENELAKMLCVSRVVVRNALQRLRDEKIIVTYQGKGSFFANPKNYENKTSLPSITFEDFSKIMEFRACIEQASIKKAVKIATDDELASVCDFVLQMESAKDNLNNFTLADYGFHLQIIKSTDNPMFLRAIENCKQEIITALSAMNAVNDSRDWGLNLHKKIAKAIMSRDAKTAINLLIKNDEYNIARMKQLLFNSIKGEDK